MNDTFPYRNKLYSNEYKINIFNNLKKYNLSLHKMMLPIKKQINNTDFGTTRDKKNDLPIISIKLPNPLFLYRGDFYRLIFNTKNYHDVLILSDLFIDQCRAKCKFSNFMSPYDFYYKNKKLLFDYIKNNNLELNDINIRDAIYYTIGFECSTHNPRVLKFFIKKYKAKKILDMSSGWGDHFGFNFQIYKTILYKKLYKYIDPLKNNIRRLWIVIGSGTVLFTLQKLLPNTLFLDVQIGRDVKSEEIFDAKRLTLYKSSYKLYEKYNGTIPYTTESTYDAKVLEFVEQFGEPDDYIWNVSGLRSK